MTCKAVKKLPINTYLIQDHAKPLHSSNIELEKLQFIVHSRVFFADFTSQSSAHQHLLYCMYYWMGHSQLGRSKISGPNPLFGEPRFCSEDP